MPSFLIEDWMMSDGLKLKGCELFLYALIHSYTKAGKTMFESEQSLGERFGYSRRNVVRSRSSRPISATICYAGPTGGDCGTG